MTVPFRIASFAQDNAGELYVLAYSGGGVYRIERNPATEQGGPAARLSETGCFASLTEGDPTPAPGVRDYIVSQNFWSDGASKRRQFALPDGKVIDTADSNDWQLPEGGLVIKHFYLHDRIIETRFLAHHEGGQESGYTYEWNEALDDAKLVPSEGLVKAFGDLNWEYPSRGDCLRCHSEQAGYTLSLESRQLNISLGNDEANQIDLLATAGYLDNDSPEKKKAYPTVEELSDPSISLEHRAKSWLHVNCSSCHQGRGSAGRAIWDARFKVPVAEKRLCESKPFEAVGELPALEALVAPGAHEFSTTWLRANARGTSIAMPPISSTVVDRVGVALLAEWIDSLDGFCPPLGDRLPGRVQAQNYDNAFDLTPGNEGPSAQCDNGDNVDLAETTDEDGSCVVGFTDPGEWVEYDVNVAEGGADTLTLRVASGKEPNGRPAAMALRIDDETVVGKIEVPAKGWTYFQSVEVSGLDLSAGNHVIRLTFSTGFANLNYFDVR